MVVTLVVILILAAIAIPTLTRAFAVYQMNDSAARLAGILKYARYEAIRLNKQVPARIQAVGSNWSVFADINNNGTADPTEAIDLIIMPQTLMAPAGMPDTSPISSSLGSPTLVLTPMSGVNGSILFDQRGAVLTNGGSSVFVMFLGNTADLNVGYRAVVLLPSGMVQVWSSSSGAWQLVT
jgi:type II secretory pathway pseudopilin PulG